MSETGTITERAGKYLTFVLAEEDYGLEILKVRRSSENRLKTTNY